MMADRQQFFGVEATDPELIHVLQTAKNSSATEDELREQRISFAFGNALANENITKDSVRYASEHVRLLR
jgi:hypothetical protein